MNNLSYISTLIIFYIVYIAFTAANYQNTLTITNSNVSNLLVEHRADIRNALKVPSFKGASDSTATIKLITEPKITLNCTTLTLTCAGPEVCPMCWDPELYSFITNFNYSPPSEKEMESLYQLRELYRTEIPNNTPDKIVRTASFSKILTNNMQWSFQESQNLSVRTILSTKIPFPTPEQDSETSVNLDISKILDNTIVWNDEVEYNGTTEVSIAPYTVADVTAYSKWIPENVVIPFASQVEFTSPTKAACWICNNNGYVCMEASLSGQNIFDILSSKGFPGKILEVRQNSVVAALHGVLLGSYGTHTTFVVKQKTQLLHKREQAFADNLK